MIAARGVEETKGSQSEHKTVTRDDNTKPQTKTRQPSKLENESAFLEENGGKGGKAGSTKVEDKDKRKISHRQGTRFNKNEDKITPAETKRRSQTRTKLGQDTTVREKGFYNRFRVLQEPAWTRQRQRQQCKTKRQREKTEKCRQI